MTVQLLVRYGELALKSAPVRREFEGALRRNLLDQFVHAGMSGRVRADHGHLYVEADEAAPALRLIARVFGVTSASVVHEVPTDRALLTARLLELAEPRLHPGASFAVRARRTGQHPFTSQELARDLGGDVLDRFRTASSGSTSSTPRSNSSSRCGARARTSTSTGWRDPVAFLSAWRVVSLPSWMVPGVRSART